MKRALRALASVHSIYTVLQSPHRRNMIIMQQLYMHNHSLCKRLLALVQKTYKNSRKQLQYVYHILVEYKDQLHFRRHGRLISTEHFNRPFKSITCLSIDRQLQCVADIFLPLTVLLRHLTLSNLQIAQNHAVELHIHIHISIHTYTREKQCVVQTTVCVRQVDYW